MEADTEILSQALRWAPEVQFKRMRRDYMNKGSRNPEQLTRTLGTSWTPDLHLGWLHGTKVGPMQVDDSCMAWSDSGTWIYPWSGAGFWGAISYAGVPCWTLMQVPWCCLNVMCQALFTSLGRPYPFQGVKGVCVVGVWEVGR